MATSSTIIVKSAYFVLKIAWLTKGNLSKLGDFDQFLEKKNLFYLSFFAPPFSVNEIKRMSKSTPLERFCFSFIIEGMLLERQCIELVS